MGEFMEEDGVVMLHFGEEGTRGHIDGVADWGVVRPGFVVGDGGTVGYSSEDLLTSCYPGLGFRVLGLDLQEGL